VASFHSSTRIRETNILLDTRKTGKETAGFFAYLAGRIAGQTASFFPRNVSMAGVGVAADFLA
jgi:hypothetical protein